MRHYILVAFLILLALLAVLIWQQSPSATTIVRKQKLLSVAVVQSMTELKQQSPFYLAEGGCVKLGISDQESYIGGGVLLYCLDKGVPVSWKESAFEPLGPIRYEVVRAATAARRESEQLTCNCAVTSGDQSEFLFCALVRTPVAGKYTIRFVTAGGDSVGSASITVNEPNPHPWQPTVSCSSDGGFILSYDREEGAALPNFFGNIGTDIPAKLPQLVLGKDACNTGDLKIVLEGDSLKLSFGRPVTDRLDWCLLCRWWVNGLAVAPLGTAERDVDYAPHGKLFEDETMETEVDIDVARLGAKPGDTISIQVMYVPFGWQYAGSGESYRLFVPVKTLVHPMVSNRVDFIFRNK